MIFIDLLQISESLPCNYLTHETRVLSLGSNGGTEQFFGPMPESTSLMMVYKGQSRTVIKTNRLTSAIDLISGLGGNLGLFLGFSLISTLYSIYDYFNTWINWVSK